MARVTSEEFALKHASRLKGATSEIRAGVAKVTEAPTLKAAAKKDKMKTNLNAAIDSGKWERGLKAVSLEDWKGKMADKGIARIGAGIDAAHAKQVAFADQLLPHVDAGKSKISSMPDVSLEDNIQRMVEMTRHMSTFKRR